GRARSFSKPRRSSSPWPTTACSFSKRHEPTAFEGLGAALFPRDARAHARLLAELRGLLAFVLPLPLSADDRLPAASRHRRGPAAPRRSRIPRAHSLRRQSRYVPRGLSSSRGGAVVSRPARDGGKDPARPLSAALGAGRARAVPRCRPALVVRVFSFTDDFQLRGGLRLRQLRGQRPRRDLGLHLLAE